MATGRGADGVASGGATGAYGTASGVWARGGASGCGVGATGGADSGTDAGPTGSGCIGSIGLILDGKVSARISGGSGNGGGSAAVAAGDSGRIVEAPPGRCALSQLSFADPSIVSKAACAPAATPFPTRPVPTSAAAVAAYAFGYLFHTRSAFSLERWSAPSSATNVPAPATSR